MAQTAGVLQIGPLAAAGGWNGLYTTGTFDFTNAYAEVTVVQPASATGDYTMFAVVYNSGNFYRVWINNGTLAIEQKIGGTKSTLASLAYSPTDHARVRIVNQSGSLLFQTAPACGAWTTRYTGTWNATAVPLGALQFELKAGNSAADSTTRSAQFDSFVAAKLTQPQAPYNGAPVAIPGAFEAEDFDFGGEGVAYHDAVAGNAGCQYRPDEDVDIITAPGNASGYVVNNFQTGEWMEYTISATYSGDYTISLHASSQYTTSQFHLEIDGQTVAGPITVPNTGLWSSFTDVTTGPISIAAGTHVLRVFADQEYFNLDAIHIDGQAQSPYYGTPFAVPGTFQAEDFDLGGEGVAYHDNVAGNAGGLYRPNEDVDIIAASGNASGYVVNNFETGEWLEYTIQVANSGNYTIAPFVSSQYTTSQFHLEIDGQAVGSPTTVPNTGLWSSFTSVPVSGISLSAGTHVLRVSVDQQYFNIDAITVSNDTSSCPTIHVASGGDLQTALNSAAQSACATVALAPGATYPGKFFLRAHAGPGYVTLTTDGPLPAAGQRVTPSVSGTLAMLKSPTNEAVLNTDAAASYYKIVGIEFLPDADPRGPIVLIGSPTTSNVADQPQYVVMDRVLVRGDPTNGQKRGIEAHAANFTLENSWVSGIRADPASVGDTQAFYANNGPGPYTITNNYIEGASENILFGGDTVRIQNLIPSDILIENNTISKPLSWMSGSWNVKNILELKNAQRVTIRGNILSGCWVQGQAGYAVVFTPRNQNNDSPWVQVKDVVFESNRVSDTASGINILGDDNEAPSQRTTNLTIRNNLVVARRATYGGDGRFIMVGRAPQYLTVENNTTDTDGSSWWYTYTGGTVTTSQGLVARYNLTLHNTYGFLMSGSSPGTPSLEAGYPGYVFTGNVLAGGTAPYPSGNDLPTVTYFKSQFVNWDGGDYHLINGSAYAGKGVDFSQLP